MTEFNYTTKLADALVEFNDRPHLQRFLEVFTSAIDDLVAVRGATDIEILSDYRITDQKLEIITPDLDKLFKIIEDHHGIGLRTSITEMYDFDDETLIDVLTIDLERPLSASLAPVPSTYMYSDGLGKIVSFDDREFGVRKLSEHLTYFD